MNLLSLEQALADSQTFEALIRTANVPKDDAIRLLAALANVPIRQAIRVCTSARNEMVRRANRDVRRAGR